MSYKQIQIGDNVFRWDGKLLHVWRYDDPASEEVFTKEEFKKILELNQLIGELK